MNCVFDFCFGIIVVEMQLYLLLLLSVVVLIALCAQPSCATDVRVIGPTVSTAAVMTPVGSSHMHTA